MDVGDADYRVFTCTCTYLPIYLATLVVCLGSGWSLSRGYLSGLLVGWWLLGQLPTDLNGSRMGDGKKGWLADERLNEIK